ncbi:MAG: glycosyltransferase [Nitrososphaerota archaeon]
MKKDRENNPGPLRILILDVLWRESIEETTPVILGGLILHQRVLEYLNKNVLTIGLSSHPPIFKHRITYAVRQGFRKPLRLEFYRYLVRLMIAFLKIVRTHKPHVVYNPGVGWHNDWLTLFAKFLGLKTVSYFHHYSLPGGSVIYPRNILDFPRLGKMCRELKRVSRIPFFKLLDYLVLFQQLKTVDIVFTGTSFGLEQLRRIGRRKLVSLTRIGIDLEEFNDEPPADHEKIWDGLFVGRMAPEKGIYDLLDIWRKVVDKIPGAKLAVVGKIVQQYSDRWLDMVKKMRLEENVFHLGELDRKELIKTYYSSRVFVFPSKIEGAGIVIAEAMVAGLPVVARNLPTYKTLYSGAPALYLFNELKDLSMKVIELLTLTENRHILGLANRAYAVKRFSWRNVSQKILSSISTNIFCKN